MSALRKAAPNRAPEFTTYTEVEVNIDPEDLEREGWVYVGKAGKGQPTTKSVVDIVERWHNDHHDGPWRWCEHELCDQLRDREVGS